MFGIADGGRDGGLAGRERSGLVVWHEAVWVGEVVRGTMVFRRRGEREWEVLRLFSSVACVDTQIIRAVLVKHSVQQCTDTPWRPAKAIQGASQSPPFDVLISDNRSSTCIENELVRMTRSPDI